MGGGDPELLTSKAASAQSQNHSPGHAQQAALLAYVNQLVSFI